MNEAQLLHEHIERLANLLRNETRREGHQYGLLPVQVEALHYLSICNRYSNTPMGVTDYLGQTKGTVSQSLKVLEKKGYLTKQADKKDKRISHLMVTETGQKLLQQWIPSPLFSQACGHLGPEVTQQLNTHLKSLLQSIQHSNQLKSFGVCHSCRYFKNARNDQPAQCGLTTEELSKADSELICREHETTQD